MDKLVYTAATGLKAHMAAQAAIANNMANASTTVGDTNFIQTVFPPPGSQNILAAGTGGGIYTSPGNLSTLEPASITNIGGSQAHANRQPFLVLNVCIALIGTFPSRN